MDGGDRTSILDSRSSEVSSPENVQGRLHPTLTSQHTVSIGSVEERIRLTLSLRPTSTILVTNLPTVLFSQPPDLHPLLYPFGPIKQLEILASSSIHLTDSISVTVEYLATSHAQEAKETLHGQTYANHTLTAEYVEAAFTGVEARSTPSNCATWPAGRSSPSNLNPFAAPFVLEPSPAFRSSALSYNNSENRSHNNYTAPSHRLHARIQHTSYRAPPPFLPYRLAPSSMPSKLNSAMSW